MAPRSHERHPDPHPLPWSIRPGTRGGAVIQDDEGVMVVGRLRVADAQLIVRAVNALHLEEEPDHST